MADIVFIAIGLAFFAVCVGYVRGLDRIARAAEDDEERAANPLHERR